MIHCLFLSGSEVLIKSGFIQALTKVGKYTPTYDKVFLILLYMVCLSMVISPTCSCIAFTMNDVSDKNVPFIKMIQWENLDFFRNRKYSSYKIIDFR